MQLLNNVPDSARAIVSAFGRSGCALLTGTNAEASGMPQNTIEERESCVCVYLSLLFCLKSVTFLAGHGEICHPHG